MSRSEPEPQGPADETPPAGAPAPTETDSRDRSQAAATPWPEGFVWRRQDKICAALIGLMTAFGIAMLPLRPVVLGMAPLVLVALTGSRTAMVACGALAATGHLWWPVPLVIGVLSIVKFDPVFWWAGRLWGDRFIASLAGNTPRAQRNAKRAESVARRFDVLAIALTYIPFVPIPGAIIYAVLGTSGTSLRRFLAIDLVWATAIQSLWIYLGWTIGEPVVAVLEEYAKYSWYLTIAIIAFMIYGGVRQARKDAAKATADAA